LTYQEILEAAIAVQEAVHDAARAADPGSDEGIHAASAVLDADRTVMAVKVLVELYFRKS
jgi:anti-sigma regulatory factor (Ser/Thr protein kinase)